MHGHTNIKCTLRHLGVTSITSIIAGTPTHLWPAMIHHCGCSSYLVPCRDAIDRTWIDCSATPVGSAEQDRMSAFQSDFVVRRESLYIVFTAIFINYEVFVSFQQSRLWVMIHSNKRKTHFLSNHLWIVFWYIVVLCCRWVYSWSLLVCPFVFGITTENATKSKWKSCVYLV